MLIIRNKTGGQLVIVSYSLEYNMTPLQPKHRLGCIVKKIYFVRYEGNYMVERFDNCI